MPLFALRSSCLGMAAGIFGLLCLSALPTQAQQVYNNDFTGGSTMGFTSGNLLITTRTDNSETYLATPGTSYGYDAGTVTLTLTNLAPHSAATLAFDLYIIGSWDGSAPGAINGGGPGDTFQLTENANTLLNTSFANYASGNTQDFLDQAHPNMPGQAPRTGEFAEGHLGYGNGTFGDATYRFSYTFTDTSPTLTFNFTGRTNEGAGNEGWGLDNVRVSITPTAVPEPGSIALLVGIGATGAAFLRRRKLAHTSA